MSNAFKPDRSDGCEGVRHIPFPAQGDTLIDSGGTPSDFMAAPEVKMWDNDAQPSHHISVPWSPLDATAALAGKGIGIDFMGTVPRVAGFTPGPGDHTPGDDGWD